MTDMGKSTALRVMLFIPLVLFAFCVTALVDIIYERIAIRLGLPNQPSVVEGAAFCYLLWKVLWGWLTERVWIGRRS